MENTLFKSELRKERSTEVRRILFAEREFKTGEKKEIRESIMKLCDLAKIYLEKDDYLKQEDIQEKLLVCLINELIEVRKEAEKEWGDNNHRLYIEDELGDVFWVFVLLLQSFKKLNKDKLFINVLENIRENKIKFPYSMYEVKEYWDIEQKTMDFFCNVILQETKNFKNGNTVNFENILNIYIELLHILERRGRIGPAKNVFCHASEKFKERTCPDKKGIIFKKFKSWEETKQEQKKRLGKEIKKRKEAGMNRAYIDMDIRRASEGWEEIKKISKENEDGRIKRNDQIEETMVFFQQILKRLEKEKNSKY